MPTSRPYHLHWICQEIINIKPKSILDIGIGFGSKGMLFREYTDVWNQRYWKKDWQVKIDGIEIFKKYITQLQKKIYDNIFIGNALEVIDKLDNYDLIYCGDMIEHLKKEEGLKLIEKMKEHAKIVIIATPIIVSDQKTVLGNKYETHKSQWIPANFDGAAIHQFENTLIAKYGI